MTETTLDSKVGYDPRHQPWSSKETPIWKEFYDQLQKQYSVLPDAASRVAQSMEVNVQIPGGIYNTIFDLQKKYPDDILETTENGISNRVDNMFSLPLYAALHTAITYAWEELEEKGNKRINFRIRRRQEVSIIVDDYFKFLQAIINDPLTSESSKQKYQKYLHGTEQYDFLEGKVRKDILRAMNVTQEAYFEYLKTSGKEKSWFEKNPGKRTFLSTFAAVILGGLTLISYAKEEFRKEAHTHSATVEARINSRLEAKEEQLRKELEERATVLLEQAEDRYRTEKHLLIEEVRDELRAEITPLTQNAQEAARIARKIEKVLDRLAPRFGINPDEFEDE